MRLYPAFAANPNRDSVESIVSDDSTQNNASGVPADRPPSVDQLARSLSHHQLPHPVLVDVARKAIAEGRHEQADELAEARKRAMLMPVINGTGVLLHTNLGRAPITLEVEPTFSNLELSLATGQRGSRQKTVGDLLATACGAEAAMVVNNCASAVLLSMAALATGKRVAVGRGELVEIGGGFRIPDVMRQSGAELVEVGTTNRCRLSDYTAADDLAMVLKVHRSNYKIVGFTQDVSIQSLAGAPELNDVAVVVDLGSGLLDASCPWLSGPPPAWLAEEPAVRQTLDAGADLVLFSGDKLFGGPQAGIIAGRRDLVEQCGRHPLARALRPGSLVLNAVQHTTLAYLDRRGEDIPLWRMAARTPEELASRADAIATAVGHASVTSAPCESVPGGGTLPTVTFPSHGLRISGNVVDDLRSQTRPIIARIDDDDTVIDLRTVAPADDADIIEAIRAVTNP